MASSLRASLDKFLVDSSASVLGISDVPELLFDKFLSVWSELPTDRFELSGVTSGVSEQDNFKII